ncbi:acylphosphatase [Niabella soli]|uniref:Acylphosphatase-like domain-containing protein n=1 Tax=Niabella soli DSM 19437 TaxID=929713 RepID=W0F2G3_9BACT|nr:hypothetical protein [Niabella soli]AHF17225.1 hypothetical protein NIASO_04045 [Niabella soli DSM 19437]
MITIEISIKGAPVHAAILEQLEQKARELSITGTLTRNSDGTSVLLSSGTEADVTNYVNWFENLSRQQGFRPEVKNIAFKAFYKFSVS